MKEFPVGLRKALVAWGVIVGVAVGVVAVIYGLYFLFFMLILNSGGSWG